MKTPFEEVTSKLIILPKSAKKRTFEAPVLQFKIVDGDTFDLLLDVGFGGREQVRCRLLGLDAPEIDTRAGQLVTLITYDWMASVGDLLWKSKKVDKYGRSLGELVSEGGWTLNLHLLKYQLAKAYDGETKRVWSNDELTVVELAAAKFLHLES